MRVISGIYKGRVIKGHDIDGTRPTMDRVKESLFAIISSYLENSVVLDLFAGSGNLGIEAICYGGKMCYFVDNNIKCIKVINDNIKTFGISNNCVTLNSDYKEALKYFSKRNIKFDIIFVDPPYKFNIIVELLELINNNNLLNDKGIIVFEHQQNDIVENSYFNLLRHKKYGDKFVSIYQKL